MTTTPLSTIELETGFLRRDGNHVAADEIERAARELARTTTMTDVDTVKNCPWCGSSARVYQPIEGFDYWTTECTGDIDEESGCFAESPYIAGYDTKEKAVKAWNTRPAESALAAERDELERLVEKHEANNGYNAMLQLGMMQLLKEVGVWPKSSEIIAAHGRHEQETQERLDRATKDEALTAYQRKGE